MKNLSKHAPHYLSLFGIFAAALLGFIIFSYDKDFLVFIAISLSFAYFSWGVVHHSIHKDLTFGVMLEYLGISLLGLIIILSLLYRS